VAPSTPLAAHYRRTAKARAPYHVHLCRPRWDGDDDVVGAWVGSPAQPPPRAEGGEASCLSPPRQTAVRPVSRLLPPQDQSHHVGAHGAVALRGVHVGEADGCRGDGRVGGDCEEAAKSGARQGYTALGARR
jgi:hypothetical protein